MNNPLSKEDLILYILNKLEPEKSDKIRLNKLAFFAEFAYMVRFEKQLSNAEYAAIDMGPVINDYDALLIKMEKVKQIKIDGYRVRPLVSPTIELSLEDRTFVDTIIDKYSKLSKEELIGLSHLTDAYKITTKNEKVMGNVIDKHLALLETFLSDEMENGEVSEDTLPAIDRSKLIKYAR